MKKKKFLALSILPLGAITLSTALTSCAVSAEKAVEKFIMYRIFENKNNSDLHKFIPETSSGDDLLKFMKVKSGTTITEANRYDPNSYEVLPDTVDRVWEKDGGKETVKSNLIKSDEFLSAVNNHGLSLLKDNPFALGSDTPPRGFSYGFVSLDVQKGDKDALNVDKEGKSATDYNKGGHEIIKYWKYYANVEAETTAGSETLNSLFAKKDDKKHQDGINHLKDFELYEDTIKKEGKKQYICIELKVAFSNLDVKSYFLLFIKPKA